MEFLLTRTGNSPLKFNGELIDESESSARQGPSQNRYFELSTYRTDAGKYVGAIRYRTHWHGENDLDFAQPFADAVALRQWFSGFDPCDPKIWRGIPDNVHDASRRNEFYRNAIASAYAVAVTELLAGDEFAETVE